MDGHRFDHLAKTLATSTSRRRLLAGLLGTALTGLGVSRAAAQTACPRDTPIRCGDTCADLRTDPANCARCGNACAAGQICYAGRCRNDCPNGFEACNGTCHRACSAGQVRLNDCTCCTPSTCASLGAECGELPDGCGGLLDCGACTEPDTCGGGGIANVCGCTPAICDANNCGAKPDGCGGVLACGECPVDADQICVEPTCRDRCTATLQAAGCLRVGTPLRWACPSANLQGANLAGCDLPNASASNANLSDADLSDANLSNATIGNTNLTGANLSNANLTNAVLLGTTDLTGANLNGANLSGVFWANTVTCPNGANAGASGSTCCGQLLDDHSPSAGC